LRRTGNSTVNDHPLIRFKYSNLLVTEWRRNPTHQGGYILDGGVHYIATLRTLLAAQPGNEIARVSAFTGLVQPYLPPVDTADAILRTRSGVTGTFQIWRGTSIKADEWTVACENGSVTVLFDKVIVNRNGQEAVETVPNERSGVPPVVRAWGKSLVSGKLSWEQEPEAALGDLELVSHCGLSSTCDHAANIPRSNSFCGVESRKGHHWTASTRRHTVRKRWTKDNETAGE